MYHCVVTPEKIDKYDLRSVIIVSSNTPFYLSLLMHILPEVLAIAASAAREVVIGQR